MRTQEELKTSAPLKALVLTFSQTGHTGIYGKLIAKTLESHGIQVTASDYRNLKKDEVSACDLLIVGTPINYMEVPTAFASWLESIPRIGGTPTAAFVSYGGPGSNVHNVQCMLMDILAQKGGVPIAMSAFGNMSTFAPTWSTGNEKRTLKYQHLPDEKTFQQVRDFTNSMISKIKAKRRLEYSREFEFSGIFGGGISIWGTKILISKHHINHEECIECMTCEESCPVGAVDQKSGKVNTEKCVACFGCVNNCPTGAMKMKYLSSDIIGFRRFIESKGVEIRQPKELA